MTSTADDVQHPRLYTDPATVPHLRLMAQVNGRLAANRGSGPDLGWLAAVRAGITSAGTATAIARAGTYLAGLRATQRTGALRAAAIRAINPGVPQTVAAGDDSVTRPAARPLGRSLADLYRSQHNGSYPSDTTGNDQIVMQVNMLPMLDIEAAAQILNGLIGRCADATYPTGTGGRARVHVDFFDLARTLTHWGNGISPASRRTREQIVLDFYSAAN